MGQKHRASEKYLPENVVLQLSGRLGGVVTLFVSFLRSQWEKVKKSNILNPDSK